MRDKYVIEYESVKYKKVVRITVEGRFNMLTLVEELIFANCNILTIIEVELVSYTKEIYNNQKDTKISREILTSRL